MNEYDFLNEPVPKDPISYIPTPYAVICREHGLVYMTREFYMDQLMSPDYKWLCPICFEDSSWNDENYEKWYSEEVDTING